MIIINNNHIGYFVKLIINSGVTKGVFFSYKSISKLGVMGWCDDVCLKFEQLYYISLYDIKQSIIM